MHIDEYQVFQGLNSWVPVAYSSQVPIGLLLLLLLLLLLSRFSHVRLCVTP